MWCTKAQERFLGEVNSCVLMFVTNTLILVLVGLCFCGWLQAMVLLANGSLKAVAEISFGNDCTCKAN